MKPTLELIERFHEKWALNPRTGCWEWTASIAGKGYGQIKLPGERRQIYAHRLAYLIFYGELPEDRMVCHTCDNPRCVRPSHLFLGSAADNLGDMRDKDRHLRGERNAKAKLTDDKVRHMHRLSAEGVSQGRIAAMMGVSQGVVWRILHGESWAHIYREIAARAGASDAG